MEENVQRATLRAVLAALLQVEDGPCLDHYQLTPTAAAAAAQHSQELASLQAQLAALQQEKRQLFGKSAQQSRNARQAAAAAGELQGQLEQLRQQLARQSKQLEAKEAALASTSEQTRQNGAGPEDPQEQLRLHRAPSCLFSSPAPSGAAASAAVPLCRMIAPLIDELASEYSGKMVCFKLNTDESPGVATEYGIRSIPTVMIFKGGKKMETIIGAVPKASLVQSLEKYL
ncbi:hypothetical protein OEZ86_011669 [Tetradesmus obliquus]|nr:hypothetical protein OEZ86_011669 [Tetradesmus obliquus]